MSAPNIAAVQTFQQATGPVSQSRNRIRSNVAVMYDEATNTMFWTIPQGIHELTVLVTAISGEVAQNTKEDYVLATVNALNAAQAAVLLAAPDSPNTDAQLIKFMLGVPRVIPFDRDGDSIIRLDLLPVINGTVGSIHAFVEAH